MQASTGDKACAVFVALTEMQLRRAVEHEPRGALAREDTVVGGEVGAVVGCEFLPAGCTYEAFDRLRVLPQVVGIFDTNDWRVYFVTKNSKGVEYYLVESIVCSC